MATCEITTFETHLSPSRNALVDDIQTYLHTDCSPRYHNDQFGFLKMALDMELILPLGQDDVMQNEFGNYAEIVQSDRIWYYFITACEWTSQNAIKVKLSIDSINTFREDLEWSPQTTIEREHLDRMFLGGDGKVYRYIDPEPENIPTAKHIENKTKLLQNNQDTNWYLIYDSEQIGSENAGRIRCRLLTDNSLTVYKSSSTGPSVPWVASSIPSGQYRYFSEADNSAISITFGAYWYDGISWQTIVKTFTTGDEIHVLGPSRTEHIGTITITYETIWTGIINGYRVTNNNGLMILNVGLRDITVTEQGAIPASNNYCFLNTSSNRFATAPDGLVGAPIYQTGIILEQAEYYRYSTTADIPIPYVSYIIPDTDKVAVGAGSGIVLVTRPFSEVDRTATELVKIINLPYAPCEISYDSSTGVTTFPPEWVYENGFMRLKDDNLNTEFGTTITSINLTDALINQFDTNNTRNVTDVRREWRESKMFGSQFSTYKLVYDSFALEVPLENIYYYDPDAIGISGANIPISFDITFKPSNTMNSHFAFYADLDNMISTNPNLWDGTRYLHHGDYDEYTITTRNNEESIFSSAYLDYIRNGYNYDKKLKADQAAMSYLMGGLQVVGSVISFAASTVTGGVSVAAGVALATSAISTFASAAHNDAAAGEKINQKLKELALQGSNVSSGDDVDLLKFYAGNKAYWIRYVTDAHQYYPLLDLFHYCGYKHPRHEVPNVTSRYWFNFIQCAPIFSNEGQFVWQNYLDDVRARYRAGVTVYHRHSGLLSGTAYDWDQTHENWETGLAQIALDSDWVEDINMDDDLGFVGYYNGPLTLNGTTLYLEGKWEYGSVTKTANSIGQTIAPSTNFHFGQDGQYQYQGAVISWRIVSTDPHYATTDWGHKTM